MSIRRKLQIFAIVASILAVILALAFGFSAGYKFSSFAKDNYTKGFEADFKFLPQVVSAFLTFSRRDYEIADPVKQEARLEQIRPLRIGVYRPWEGYRIPVYDGLEALGLDVRIVEPPTQPEELVETLDVLVFPQGAYRLTQLPAGEGQRLRQAIGGGLDYIGICAGTYFAVDDLAIAPVVHRQLKMVSLVNVRTLENEFWGDLGGREYQVHFSGGGYFPIASLGDFEPLVAMENLGAMAIKGSYDKGRVILFTFHPEGGGLTRNNQSIFFSGRDLGSGEMLLGVLQNLAEAGDG